LLKEVIQDASASLGPGEQLLPAVAKRQIPIQGDEESIPSREMGDRGEEPCGYRFLATDSQDAAASSVTCTWRRVPFLGPRLRALMILMRSRSSWGEQFFLASSASAA